jgi:hypothetical protein
LRFAVQQQVDPLASKNFGLSGPKMTGDAIVTDRSRGTCQAKRKGGKGDSSARQCAIASGNAPQRDDRKAGADQWDCHQEWRPEAQWRRESEHQRNNR